MFNISYTLIGLICFGLLDIALGRGAIRAVPASLVAPKLKAFSVLIGDSILDSFFCCECFYEDTAAFSPSLYTSSSADAESDTAFSDGPYFESLLAT